MEVTLTNPEKWGISIPQDAPRQAGVPTERHRASGAEDSRSGKTARNLPLSSDGSMTSTDTPKTDTTNATPQRDLVLQSRAELRDLLIKAGLARAAAEKVARGGWPELSREITETDLAEDCADLARTLSELLEN
jgi:hypothetical protein